ncbi:hypothetical protein Lal_00012437 [Lupinus albus]|nr:hypothetical protein Lal_00012437 [Lupinus albus]
MKFQRLLEPIGQGYRLVQYNSVARVRPRTSEGITDLLVTILPPKPKDFDFSSGASGVLKETSADPWSASFMVETRTSCFEHSNFIKVTVSERIASRRDEPTGAHQWRTDRPNPRSNYELFNCNNINIRYSSWNYRGCWHQTRPPMDPR